MFRRKKPEAAPAANPFAAEDEANNPFANDDDDDDEPAPPAARQPPNPFQRPISTAPNFEGSDDDEVIDDQESESETPEKKQWVPPASMSMWARKVPTEEPAKPAAKSSTKSNGAKKRVNEDADVANPFAIDRQSSNPFGGDEDEELRSPVPAPVKAKPVPAKMTQAKLLTPALAKQVNPFEMSVSKTTPSPTPSPQIKPTAMPVKVIAQTKTAVAKEDDSNPFAAASSKPASRSVSRSVSASHTPVLNARQNPNVAIDDDVEPLDDNDSGDDDSESLTSNEKIQAMINDAAHLPSSTFRTSFDGRTFLADITKPFFDLLVSQSQSKPKSLTRDDSLTADSSFDPQPLNDLLSAALKRVNALRDDVDSQISIAVSQSQRAESDYSQKLQSYSSSFATLTSKFQRLENRISSVSATAVTIGGRLEGIDNQKQNAVKTSELITHYLAFSTGDVNNVSAVFQAKDGHQLMYAAELIQMLSVIAHDIANNDSGSDSVSGSDNNALPLIEATSNSIEATLLSRFHSAMARHSVDDMRPMARVLLGFKEKTIITKMIDRAMDDLSRRIQSETESAQSSKKRQENENENRRLLTDNDGESDGSNESGNANTNSHSIVIPAISGDLTERMDDNNAPPAEAFQQFREVLLRVYECVLAVIRDEHITINAVFPQPVLVLRAIIEQIFLQRISPLIDSELRTVKSQSGNSEEIELIALSQSYYWTLRLCKQFEIIMRAMTGYTSNDNTALVECVNLTFNKHWQAYLAKEAALLTGTCRSAIQRGFHSQSQPSAGGDDGDFLGFKKRSNALNDKHRQLLSVLSGEVIDECLKAMNVSVRRCMLLTDRDSHSDAVYSLFKVTFTSIIDDFLAQCYADVMAVFPTASSLITDANKSEMDLFYLQCVRELTHIIDRLTQHYNHLILPIVSVNTNTLTIAETQFHQSLQSLEAKVLAGLNRYIELVLATVTRMLTSLQKSNDFRPKEDASLFSLSSNRTEACLSVCQLLSKLLDGAMKTIDGRNLDAFLTVIGTKFYFLLIEHLHRFVVSPLGATQLLNDCKGYEDMVASFHITKITEKFSLLRHLTQMFFVSVEHLQSFLHEPRIQKVDREELAALVRMRVDFATNKTKIMEMLKQ